MIFEQDIYPEDIQEKLNAIELIQKGFDLGKIDSLTYQKSLESLEKAKRDISKLRTIRKIVHRDGKTFFATYHVRRDGTEVEDLKKPAVEVHPSTPETFIGDFVKLITSTGEIHTGVVHKIDAKGRSGVTQLFLETSPGYFKSVTVTKIKSLSTIERTKEVPVASEKPTEKKDKPEIPTLKGDLDFLSTLTKIGDLGGSGGTELYKGKTGEEYVIKKERSGVTGQLKDEVIADRIYKGMGFEAPTSYIQEGLGGKDVKVSLYTSGVKELGSLGLSAKEKAYKELRKGFVLDCLLANWDVIGAGMDNILCSSDGTEVRRSDNGGSLRYRAKGELKGKGFSDEVPEIDVFRSDKNPSAKKVFGSITNSEIKQQIKEIRENFSEIEKVLGKHGPSPIGVNDPELLKKLNTRLKFLEDKFAKIPDSPVITGYSVEGEKPKAALKPGMPSLTTQKYFDNGWDELQLDGVGDIKGGIKSHIIAIENSNRSKLEKWANESGLSYDDYLDKLQKTVDKVVRGSECFIAVHTGRGRYGTGKDILSEIFDSGGRFKTLFETGDSSGSTSTSARSRAENRYFAFPNDPKVSREKRPVYGYFSPEGNGVINSEGKIPPSNLVSNYGDVSFKLKKADALRKATVTFQDSLGAESGMASTPYAKPHFTSILNTFDKDPIQKLEESFSKKANLGGYSYVECQYHGGLGIENLESLHINPDVYGGSSAPRAEKFEHMNKIINRVNKFVAKTGHASLEIKTF